MSDNLPSSVELDANPDGTVTFATDVVATIAGLAATEVDGVASMATNNSGLADMLTRKMQSASRNLTRGVKVEIENNTVSVDVTIVVEYGSPVPEVAQGIQENVKKAIETMSGLDVKSIDVHVQGVSFERENRSAAELEAQRKKILEEEEARKNLVAAKAEQEAAESELESDAADAAEAESETPADETPTADADENE